MYRTTAIARGARGTWQADLSCCVRAWYSDRMSKTVVTHDGKFHADDVFAVAALLLAEPTATVVRTRDEATIGRADIVVDVGGVYDETHNRFDHHQSEGAGGRGNKIPYAAFGLVWKKFGRELCESEEVARRVDEVLVTPIDANDNGIDLSVPAEADLWSYTIADAVRAFVPTWLEKNADIDAAFLEAVSFATRVILREIARAKAMIAGEGEVRKAYAEAEDKRLIVLDGDFSWKDTLAKLPEPLFVVHPQDGTWRLYCVRDNPRQFRNRKNLPESWAGLRDAKLAQMTGVGDAVFCHRNRFMAVAKSKQSAIRLAQIALSS